MAVICEARTSVPNETVARPSIMATADPPLFPSVACIETNAPLVCPPLWLQPSVAFADLKLAHSDRFVFPSMIAPAFLSHWTVVPFLEGLDPTKS